MKTLNDWITNNYERLHSNACRIVSNPDKASDCLHICILSILESQEEKQQMLLDGGKLENFITMCVNIQWKSTTSPYHKHHRKQPQQESEYVEWKHNIEDEERTQYDLSCDCIFSELGSLHYYYRILLTDKFIEGLTYQQMNEKYKISKNSLLKDIKVGVQMLKTKCIEK